jgi:hypothetical protein
MRVSWHTETLWQRDVHGIDSGCEADARAEVICWESSEDLELSCMEDKTGLTTAERQLLEESSGFERLDAEQSLRNVHERFESAFGNAPFLIMQFQDISDRKHEAQRLEFMVDHDFLTGLFNRRHFEQELAREVARAFADRLHGCGCQIGLPRPAAEALAVESQYSTDLTAQESFSCFHTPTDPGYARAHQ